MGLSKAKRHSVAPCHESAQSGVLFPYNSEWARTSPPGEVSATSVATLAAAGRQAPLKKNILGKRSESLAVGFAKGSGLKALKGSNPFYLKRNQAVIEEQ